jgi:quercetin dioxygenase-like cupin family protein
MKSRILFVIFILTLSAHSVAQQQPDHTDPTQVSPEKYTVLLENEHVRVVEYVIKPGEKDAWHTHPPKVSYIVSGGKLRITPEGADSFVVDENSGNAAWMGALGRHFGENVGTTPIRIVLVEIKSLSDAPFEEIGKRD